MIPKGLKAKTVSWQKVFALLFLLIIFLPINADAFQSNIHGRRFISCIDGKEDCYAFITGKNNTLIVYLHSLSGDYKEPFKTDGEVSLAYSLLRELPDFSFLSLDYGKNPSWGCAAARIDISNNLRSIINELNIKNILIVGVSMGASTALTYVATAPSYIKDKIVGLVLVSPCANLEDLYKQTASPEIKSSLEDLFGNIDKAIPVGYKQNSFDTAVVFFPPKIKVAIISATEDKAIPINLQKDVIRDLSNRNVDVKSFEVEGKFEALPIKSILEASRFAMQQTGRQNEKVTETK